MTKEDKKKLVEEVLKRNSKCRICGKKAVNILPKYKSMQGSSKADDYFSLCRQHHRERRIALGLGK